MPAYALPRMNSSLQKVEKDNDAGLRRARRALMVVFFVGGAVMASWASRIPAVATGLELGPGALGFALFFMASGTPLAMPVCGAMADRYGGRRMVQAALLINCLALVLPAAAPNVWSLAAALAILGSSSGALVVAQNEIGTGIEKNLGRPILNSLHALLSFGWLVGSLSGAAAAGAGLPPLPHFAAAGTVLLAVGLFATKFLPVSVESRVAGPAFARPSAGLWSLAAISFCCLLAEGSALDWGAVYVREVLGANEGLAALAPAAFAAAMTGGRVFGDLLVGRVGRSMSIRLAAILAASGMMLSIVSGGPWLGILGYGLLGTGLSVVFPTLLSAAGEGAGSAGPQIAAVATAGYLGLLGGPALIGGLAEFLGLRAALLLIVLLIGMVPMLASRGTLEKS